MKTKEKGSKVILHVPDKIEYATVIFCQKNGAELIKDVIKNCGNSNCDDRGDYPYFVLLKDPSLHPIDITSIDDTALYISSMNEAHIADWSKFESYLRNRLIFTN